MPGFASHNWGSQTWEANMGLSVTSYGPPGTQSEASAVGHATEGSESARKSCTWVRLLSKLDDDECVPLINIFTLELSLWGVAAPGVSEGREIFCEWTKTASTTGWIDCKELTNRLAKHWDHQRPKVCHSLACLIEALTTTIFKVMDSALTGKMTDGCWLDQISPGKLMTPCQEARPIHLLSSKNTEERVPSTLLWIGKVERNDAKTCQSLLKITSRALPPPLSDTISPNI